MPVTVNAFGLVSVICNVEVPFKLMAPGENALATVTGLSTCTLKLALLLPALPAGSPPPLTLAVLVRLAGALLPTVTVRLILGYAVLGAKASPREQVNVWPATVQPQPVPVPLTGSKPVGKVSTTVTAPVLAPLPVLVTSSTNVAPVVCPL